MILLRKDRIKLAGKKIILTPLKAREGLKAIREFAKIISISAPYISLLSENSRALRISSLSKMISEVDGLDNFVFNLVSYSTGIDVTILETEATLKEIINAFIIILELNDWDKYWKIAYSLKIADQDNFAAWVYSRASKIRNK